MIEKILEFCDDVEREETVLQPYLDERSDYILQKEKKRDTKRRNRKPKEQGTTISHRPITIKEEIAGIRTWAQSKNHTPSVSFVHQHIFNSNFPVDVLDDLRKTRLELGFKLARTAQLHQKLTVVSRYEVPVDRSDIDKHMDPLDTKARCYNCGLFIQFKHRANRTIKGRTEETVCQCHSGTIQRAKMDAHISQKREDWTTEKKRKERETEKHKRHIERSAV